MTRDQKNKIRAFRTVLRRFERELQRVIDKNSGRSGVSLAQCHTIIEIGDQGATSVGELARSLQVDKSTASRTVEGLVAIGLADRVIPPDNRRNSVVSLTGRGKKLCGEINDSNDAYFEKIFRSIPAERQSPFIETFQLMVQAMSRENEIREATDNE